MSFFFRHSVGFFIQFFPCILLCFLPFSASRYRFNRKSVAVAFTVLSALFSLLFPFVMKIPLGDSPVNFANPYMLLVMTVFISGYFFIIRERLIKKALVVSLTVYYAATQYILVNLCLLLVYKGAPGEDVFGWPSFILYALTAALMLPLAIKLMGHIVRDYLIEIDIKSVKKDFLWVLCVSLVYFVMMFLYTTLTIYDDPAIWWLTWPTFLFLAVVISCFYYTLFRDSVRRKREEELLRHNEIQKIQYRKITDEIENARRMRHDVRHHLREVYDIAGRGGREEVMSYLAAVIRGTRENESKHYCENLTVNGILQYYADLSENEGISCRITAECGENAPDAVDITVVFSNVLENAVNSCMRSERADRYINIDVGTAGSALMLQVENSCNEIRLAPGAKAEGGYYAAEAFLSLDLHECYGIKSLSRTAKKYGGNARFAYDEKAKAFISQIRMNFEFKTL